MTEYIIKIIIYILCYLLVLYGLNAFDFNRFVKKGHIQEARILYFVVSMAITYLIGEFVMSVIYYFN